MYLISKNKGKKVNFLFFSHLFSTRIIILGQQKVAIGAKNWEWEGVVKVEIRKEALDGTKNK